MYNVYNTSLRRTKSCTVYTNTIMLALRLNETYSYILSLPEIMTEQEKPSQVRKNNTQSPLKPVRVRSYKLTPNV